MIEMNEWMMEWMNRKMIYEKVGFAVISYIFCDFSLEHDQLTNQPTNRQTEPLIEVLWRT